MAAIRITRAHLKSAVEEENWDLLDRLLEIDRKHIDDASYFTDTWGEWWGLLMECILREYETGVRVLLKHGADRAVGTWGDCIPQTPLEAAKDNIAIAALLQEKGPPEYWRSSDPMIPELTVHDEKVNRQGEISEQTGMIFQVDDVE
ncbi:MAG: hypothetical protein CMN77_06975 [Spirochaetaceae bacterium]|nr:hypothetical protein [Spirochaetaceae bacterium]|tara:strand:- start:24492 stop:24932 length:441 start_codon:yes stop_codon:yes gene_type:complete